MKFGEFIKKIKESFMLYIIISMPIIGWLAVLLLPKLGWAGVIFFSICVQVVTSIAFVFIAVIIMKKQKAKTLLNSFNSECCKAAFHRDYDERTVLQNCFGVYDLDAVYSIEQSVLQSDSIWVLTSAVEKGYDEKTSLEVKKNLIRGVEYKYFIQQAHIEKKISDEFDTLKQAYKFSHSLIDKFAPIFEDCDLIIFSPHDKDKRRAFTRIYCGVSGDYYHELNKQEAFHVVIELEEAI